MYRKNLLRKSTYQIVMLGDSFLSFLFLELFLLLYNGKNTIKKKRKKKEKENVMWAVLVQYPRNPQLSKKASFLSYTLIKTSYYERLNAERVLQFSGLLLIQVLKRLVQILNHVTFITNVLWIGKMLLLNKNILCSYVIDILIYFHEYFSLFLVLISTMANW